MAMTTNSFTIGDPVQTVQRPIQLGKVTRAFSHATIPEWETLVYVMLIGCMYEKAYCPDELHICKCAARIPEGVSQCQK